MVALSLAFNFSLCPNQAVAMSSLKECPFVCTYLRPRAWCQKKTDQYIFQIKLRRVPLMIDLALEEEPRTL